MGDISTVAGDGTRGFSGDGGQATAAQLNYPYSLALDGSGNLYIADRNNNRIRWVNAATGIIATVAGNGRTGFSKDGGLATQSRLYGAYGVAVDGAGYIYIGDTSSNRIRRVGPRRRARAARASRTAPRAGTGGCVREPSSWRSRCGKTTRRRRKRSSCTPRTALWISARSPRSVGSPSSRRAAAWRRTKKRWFTVTVDPAGLRVGRREGARVHTLRRAGDDAGAPRLDGAAGRGAGGVAARRGQRGGAERFRRAGAVGPRLLPVAPGSLVVVRGENFTGGEAYAAESFPLPASLGWVSVQFDGLQARLLSVGAAAHRSAGALPVGHGGA